jgi:hypothetical protein
VVSYSPIYSPYEIFADFGGPGKITVHEIWQAYAYGLNGQESLREKERSGKEWRRDLVITGKRGQRLRGQRLSAFWSKRLPIYMFIEKRIAMGDSEAVAVETCQEIFNKCQNNAGSTCLETFNKYLARNGRVHDIWQEYAYGLNGQESLREKERRGIEWRRDPIDPKTGKRGQTVRAFWVKRLPIYLFIEMRITMGDSEAVAVETCQEIANNYLNKNGGINWIELSPFLRGVLRQEENAVTKCQQIFNKYLTRNGRPISGIVVAPVPNIRQANN